MRLRWRASAWAFLTGGHVIFASQIVGLAINEPRRPMVEGSDGSFSGRAECIGPYDRKMNYESAMAARGDAVLRITEDFLLPCCSEQHQADTEEVWVV
jgi:hypothetical protein